MPRVGSSSNRIFTPALRHFPNTTFCWFPPDRVRTARLRSATLMDSLPIDFDATVSSRREDRNPARRILAGQDMTRLFETDMLSANPSRLRSSGAKPTPRANGICRV